MAATAGAVLAINGDYYGFRDTGIVIRNGVAYRDRPARQWLAFRSDGSMRLYDETTTSASRLLADGVVNTLSFGPGLVDAGKVIDGIDDVEIDTNFGNHSVQGSQPRSGVGFVEDNHFLFVVVVDGRSTGYSRGVTMSEFAQLFVDHGAQVAYNLDGGGSRRWCSTAPWSTTPSAGARKGAPATSSTWPGERHDHADPRVRA